MKPYRLAAAALSVAVLAVAAPARAQVHLISLAAGASTILTSRGITRVAVGDDRIAGVVPASDQVVLNGKSAGRTTVSIWARGARSDYEVVVTDGSVEDVAQTLRQAIDVPTVSVATDPGVLLVRGSVSDAAQRARLTDILSRFKGLADARKLSIVDAVTVENPLADVRRSLANPSMRDVRVQGDGKGNIVVSGFVHDRADAERVLANVRGSAGLALTADGKILDRLQTETTTQIGVKVHVLEIDRTGLRQLGIRLQGANPDPNNPGQFVLTDPSFIGIEGANAETPGHALNVAPFFRLTRLAPTLDAIIRTGHARVLSAPDLVTSPGQEADFLVGGEVPYAYSTGLGQVSITFKEYGVKLKFTPTLLGNGAVETKIAPEVSDLDFQSGIQLNGFTVPAFKTSRLSTDVVTHDGESVVMGGLLRRIEQRNIDKIPVLGDLPILGKLFRSTQYRTTDTDVVFVMTPDVIVR